jgi:hypothetical protein
MKSWERTRRGALLAEAKSNEVMALIQNPKVSEDLLEALLERQGAFADVVEERWQQLLWMSASNARLVTEYEYPDAPDTEHYRIHKSIFGLLEITPRLAYGMLKQRRPGSRWGTRARAASQGRGSPSGRIVRAI